VLRGCGLSPEKGPLLKGIGRTIGVILSFDKERGMKSAIGSVVQRQFGCAFGTLKEAVTQCPLGEWRKGRDDFFVPARLAFHLVQATDFHLETAEGQKAYDWDRFGVNSEYAAASDLPDQERLLGYIDEVEEKLVRRLEGLSDATMVGADYAGMFQTSLDHLIYTVRHMQHHIGQLNAELKVRGLKAGEWQ
jgi:hypothetical protein